MSIKALTRKVDQLRNKVVPPPRVIDLTGIKEKLLAELEWQIIQEGGDPNAEVEWTEEQLEVGRQLQEIIAEKVRQEQEELNIRYIYRNETTGTYETC